VFLYKTEFRFLNLSFLFKPSPIPEFNKIPQVNQSARDKFSASSSVLTSMMGPAPRSVPCRDEKRNRPNGENRSSKYKTTATTCTDNKTIIHKARLNGCKNEAKFDELVL
jgi:hypothetical protein